MEQKDGGPAFPIPLNPGQSYQGHSPCDGMLLRDYFAAKAMQGYFASPVAPHRVDTYDVAKYCYEMADAMIKARDQGGQS